MARKGVIAIQKSKLKSPGINGGPYTSSGWDARHFAILNRGDGHVKKPQEIVSALHTSANSLQQGKSAPLLKWIGFVCCAVAAALSADPAAAASYMGNWPVTVIGSKHSDGAYCLELWGDRTGDAKLTGWPLGDLINGDFLVIHGLLIADVADPLGDGTNAGLMFILPASKGSLAKGTYIQDYGGDENDFGTVTVGEKNGC